MTTLKDLVCVDSEIVSHINAAPATIVVGGPTVVLEEQPSDARSGRDRLQVAQHARSS
jgi:hypothetical protein